MNFIRTALLVALLMGPFSSQAATGKWLAARKGTQQQITSTPLTDAQRIEQEILHQVFATTDTLQCGLNWQKSTFEGKKTLIEKLPLSTKEKVLEKFATMLLEDDEYPFMIPQGTDHTQLDMFFVLTQTLMCHDKQLVERLGLCVGEKQLLKLKTKLDACLKLIAPSIKEKFSAKKLGWREQAQLIKKIKLRMQTKANPNTVQAAQQDVVQQIKVKKENPIKSALANALSALGGGLIALYSFLLINPKRFNDSKNK